MTDFSTLLRFDLIHYDYHFKHPTQRTEDQNSETSLYLHFCRGLSHRRNISAGSYLTILRQRWRATFNTRGNGDVIGTNQNPFFTLSSKIDDVIRLVCVMRRRTHNNKVLVCGSARRLLIFFFRFPLMDWRGRVSSYIECELVRDLGIALLPLKNEISKKVLSELLIARSARGSRYRERKLDC